MDPRQEHSGITIKAGESSESVMILTYRWSPEKHETLLIGFPTGALGEDNKWDSYFGIIKFKII